MCEQYTRFKTQTSKQYSVEGSVTSLFGEHILRDWLILKSHGSERNFTYAYTKKIRPVNTLSSARALIHVKSDSLETSPK